jgi:Ca2+-transporting ATPase
MSIAELRLRSGEVFRPQEVMDAPIPELFHALLDLGIRASAVDPHDPMEKAFHELGKRRSTGAANAPLNGGTLARTYGLRPDLLAMSNAWINPSPGASFLVATKGAPETIADLCHLGPDERADVTEAVNAMAAQGMRVLGIAHCAFSGPWPDSPKWPADLRRGGDLTAGWLLGRLPLALQTGQQVGRGLVATG